ncbi:MAG: Fis family transcriptional regulator [Candidatus Thiodiazotropha sp.]
MKNPHIGSSFDDFLEEEELLAEVQADAIKRVIAWQIEEHLKSTGTKKTAFAKMLGTSRSQLNRLLDPDNTSLNLKTLANAAEAMGKHLEFRLV